MDIYELQKTEHEKIIQLLKAVATANESEVASAFNLFRAELSAHKLAEEHTFFKLLEEKDENLKKHIDKIKTEHTKLEELFNHIRRSTIEMEDLKASLTKLNAILIIDIAEEDELMTIAKAVLSPEEAINTAGDMAACKLEFEQRLNDRLNN
jgi:iron-sulfur cluster repair protein YtfE (RIC family)